MKSTIKCIHCGREIEISEAISHELAEETNRIRKTVAEEARKKIQQEFESKDKEKDRQLEAEKKKSQELVEAFDKQRKKDEQRIKEEADKQAAEKHRLEKLEYEKKFADMQKALEEAQRKGKQGSQQLQGEVLELDLEGQLKAQFPLDEFLPVPKGVEGGDIWQKVKDPKGNDAGSIIWETKRAKSWDKKWLRKLREDMGRINASECVLVSQVLPSDIKGFHNLERVWVANYEYALHVARVVRFLLIKTALAKSSVSHTDEDLKKIRDYLTSDAFKHKIDMHHDTISMMMEELTSEIRLTQVRWKRREAQIKSLDNNISQLDGELQGIMGAALPDINTLSLADGDDEE